MEQRDLIKDQIEQLGKVLGKILSDFLKLKSKGQVSPGMEIANQRLLSEVDINIEKVMTLSKKELEDYLKSRKLTADHLEILSAYLKEIGKEEIEINKTDSKLKLEKAIELLDIADNISKTISFDRINKKKEINNALQQCI
ncbi:MAG: hypothetical protein ABI315_14695 [Bacteroidia bacterium]